MANLDIQEAKRQLRDAEGRVALQHKIIASHEYAGRKEAAERARDLLATLKWSVRKRQGRVDQMLCYRVSATNGANGETVTTDLLDGHAAITKAYELSDAGYDDIQFEDVSTGKGYIFTPLRDNGENE